MGCSPPAVPTLVRGHTRLPSLMSGMSIGASRPQYCPQALQPEKSSVPEPSGITVSDDVDWRSESKTSTKPPCSRSPIPICTVPLNVGVDRFVYVSGPW
jgi:hypothetical protein